MPPKCKIPKDVAVFLRREAVEDAEHSDNDSGNTKSRKTINNISVEHPNKVHTRDKQPVQTDSIDARSAGSDGANVGDPPTLTTDDITFIDRKIKGSVFRKGIHIGCSDGTPRVFIWQYVRSDAVGLPNDTFKSALNDPLSYFGPPTNALIYTPWTKGGGVSD